MLSTILPFILLILTLTPLSPLLTPTVTAASDSDALSNNPYWNPRNSHENRLFCPAPLPQRAYGHIITMPHVSVALEHLPSKFYWSYHNFSNLHDLCSLTGNPMANMGGMCKQNPDRTVTPHWKMTRARAILLWDPALADYCRANCTCANTEDEYYALDLEESIVKYRIPPVDYRIGEDGWGDDGTDAKGGWGWFSRGEEKVVGCPREFVRCATRRGAPGADAETVNAAFASEGKGSSRSLNGPLGSCSLPMWRELMSGMRREASLIRSRPMPSRKPEESPGRLIVEWGQLQIKVLQSLLLEEQIKLYVTR
ncbi:hypothetical protein MMC30_007541 [Trapelia coarctata]|nr:hypothetical protein [Trapelia coarctata]